MRNMIKTTPLHLQAGRFSTLTVLLTMAVSCALILAGYWMGQQSHKQLAGIKKPLQAKEPETERANSLDSLIIKPSEDRVEVLAGRWRVTEATRETPLRDVEFYPDGRVRLRDGSGGNFSGRYDARGGRLEIRSATDSNAKPLFAGSYSLADNRLTITHDDVVVLLVSGPEAEEQAKEFLQDNRLSNLQDVRAVAIRTEENQGGCRRQLAEELRDEDLQVIGEDLADAHLLISVQPDPASLPNLMEAQPEEWELFYSATLYGKDDAILFQFEGEVEEDTADEACETVGEDVAEELADQIDL